MFGRLRRFVTDIRLAAGASRLMRKAYALEAQRRYAEAIEVLKHVRAMVEQPDPSLASVGVRASTRLTAATLLSTIAARIGDRALALDAIEDGLRLWTEVRPHVRQGTTLDRLDEWEAWARRYVATTAGE